MDLLGSILMKSRCQQPEYQRLRSIHQLALTYNVYPGASQSDSSIV